MKIKKPHLPRIKPRRPTDGKQLNTFLKFLPPDIRLFAETYHFASQVYASIGLAYKWTDLFPLPANAVLEGPQPTIRLERSSRYGSKGECFFAHWLPPKVVKRPPMRHEKGCWHTGRRERVQVSEIDYIDYYNFEALEKLQEKRGEELLELRLKAKNDDLEARKALLKHQEETEKIKKRARAAGFFWY